MDGKLRIIKAEKVRATKNSGQTHHYWLSDGTGPHRPKELGRHVGISWETIKKRMKAYGRASWLVFYKDSVRIPKELSEPERLKQPEHFSHAPNGEPVGANVQRDGSVLTRTGKVIPANSSSENAMFKLPAAAKGPWKMDSQHTARFEPPDKEEQVRASYEKLLKFNKKMERRGFLRQSDFTNVAGLSL